MPYSFNYSIGDVLNSWADMGVFAYALPFLMIFALVYGILVKTDILGKNKGVNATIALAFGLLALQFDYVSGFYASIFPYAGMGIAVLLIAMIFLGLKGDGGYSGWWWVVIGGIVFAVVLLTSVSDMFWLGGAATGLVSAAPALFAIAIIVGIMFWVIGSGGSRSPKSPV